MLSAYLECEKIMCTCIALALRAATSLPSRNLYRIATSLHGPPTPHSTSHTRLAKAMEHPSALLRACKGAGLALLVPTVGPVGGAHDLEHRLHLLALLVILTLVAVIRWGCRI